jgi:hypothetical protein
MPLYGGFLDRDYFRHINKEIQDKITGQQIGYYKISLSQTSTNIYGESKKKMYYQPVLMTCTIITQEQTTDSPETGVSRAQLVDFNFLKSDLKDLNLVPEAGDIIMWQESYYEVDAIVENQRVMGKDNTYSLESDNEYYGESWSMVCKAHLTKANKLNIVQTR